MHRGLQGGARGPGGLGRLFVRYSKLLQRRPLLTKAVTGGALNAVGDSISQAVIERRYRTRIDSRRIAVFTLTGAALVSPLLHWWFGTLERMVRLSGIAGSLTKLAADQLLWAPCFVAFILSMCASKRLCLHLNLATSTRSHPLTAPVPITTAGC